MCLNDGFEISRHERRILHRELFASPKHTRVLDGDTRNETDDGVTFLLSFFLSAFFGETVLFVSHFLARE